MRLSVVIPTLEEAGALPRTLSALHRGAVGGPHEVMVADCGSADGTARLARELGARVVACPPGTPAGRAGPCNAGAAASGGDVLVFLDADTLLPTGWDLAIAEVLADEQTVGGAFELAFDGGPPGLRLVEWVDRVRYRISRLYYGDQALFVRAEAFRRAGGFPAVPLMESADLCRALKRIGRLGLVREAVRTSPRRFVERGVWRTFGEDVWIWLLHLLRRPIDHHGPAYWGRR